MNAARPEQAAEVVRAFQADIGRVMALIEKSEQEARSLFNSHVYPTYCLRVLDSDGPLRDYLVFFREVDEFFNNQGARVFGQSRIDFLMASYGDFQREVDEQLRSLSV